MEEIIYKIDLKKYGFNDNNIRQYYFSNYGLVYSLLKSGKKRYLKKQQQRNGGLYHFYKFCVNGKKKNVSIFKLYDDYIFHLDNFNLYAFSLIDYDLGYIQNNIHYELKKKFREPSEEFKEKYYHYYNVGVIKNMVYYLVRSLDLKFPFYLTYDDLIQEALIYLYEQYYQYDENEYIKKRYGNGAFLVFLKINIKRALIRLCKLKANQHFIISYDDIIWKNKGSNEIKEIDKIKMYSLYDEIY